MLVLLALLTCLWLTGGVAHAADKITYDDHVLPILRAGCLKCHNPDRARADLDLSTFKAALQGSGSGPVVRGGEPDASKLVKVILHQEEPTMPPSGKLPDAEVATIRKWVEGGLLENAGSKAVAATKPKLDLSAVASVGKPEGPPPMPGELLLDPVVPSERAGAATALATSPWAPLLALGTPYQVLLYHTDTFELLGVLPFPEGAVCDVAFSRNGKWLLAGGGRGGKSGLVVGWDVTSGERVLALGDEYDTVLAADLSADQQWLALGGPSRVVKVFRTSDGTLQHRLKKHTDWVTAIEFSPDSKLLATGDRNGGLVVWETASGEELYTLAGHKSAIASVCWRRPEVLLSASEDGSVRIWTMDEGQSVKNWTAHPPGVLALRSAHDGRVVTCGRDLQVAIWKADGAKQSSIAFTNDIPVRAAFSHDGGRVIAADWLGNVWLWNATNGAKLGEVRLNPPPLARRQQDLARQLQQLRQAGGTNRTATASADLASLEATAAKLERAAAYAALYRARQAVTTLKADHARRLEEATAAAAAARQAAEQLAALRQAPAPTGPAKAGQAKRRTALRSEVKSQTARQTAATDAAARLAKELAGAESRLEKLAADYEKLKVAPPPATAAAGGSFHGARGGNRYSVMAKISLLHGRVLPTVSPIMCPARSHVAADGFLMTGTRCFP